MHSCDSHQLTHHNQTPREQSTFFFGLVSFIFNADSEIFLVLLQNTTCNYQSEAQTFKLLKTTKYECNRTWCFLTLYSQSNHSHRAEWLKNALYGTGNLTQLGKSDE